MLRKLARRIFTPILNGLKYMNYTSLPRDGIEFVNYILKNLSTTLKKKKKVSIVLAIIKINQIRHDMSFFYYFFNMLTYSLRAPVVLYILSFQSYAYVILLKECKTHLPSEI